MENIKANFGFKEVDSDQKHGMVFDVFKSVAGKYDIMNDFMSFGLHRIWKRVMVNNLPLRENAQMLDIASGSGDIAIKIIRKYKAKNVALKITLSDINEHMLENGKNKVIDENLFSYADFKIADVEALPFPDSSFDFITVAFGIRNVTDIPKALKEIHRVLKIGGKFMCLEFSNVENDILAKIYETYSFNIVPKIGRVVANDEASYQYLVESIKMFPEAERFKNMISEAGFENTSYEKLTFGVVAIHSGWKL